MRSKQHIKRCPFCGGKAGLHEDYSSSWLVQCNSCGASTLRARHCEEVILRWNRRITNDFKTHNI